MAERSTEPAFPVTAEQFAQGFSGMTLHDWYVGQALIAVQSLGLVGRGDSVEHLARSASMIADAVMAQREQWAIKP